MYGEQPAIAFADEPLAQHAVTDQPDQRRMVSIAEQQLFETPYRSPLLPLWDLTAGEWLRASFHERL